MDYREISLLTERLEAHEARIAELERRLLPAPQPAPLVLNPDGSVSAPASSNPWEVTPRA